MTVAAIPDSVARYRAEYRKKVPTYYSGVGHAGFAAAVLAAVGLWHLSRLNRLTDLEWLLLPLFFLLGNWIEYILHRYPLHRPFPGLRELYQRHAVQHHQYFTNQAMQFESTDDFIMVLFPPWAHPIAAAWGTTMGVVLIWLGASSNVGHLFGFVTCLYMLTYEVFHLCHHLGGNAPSLYIGWMRLMRMHHGSHHDPRLMADYNFGIITPLFDWVYGTWKPAKSS